MSFEARLRRLIENQPDGPTPDDGGQGLSDDALVPAAVLIAITRRPEPGVLLTLRTAHLRKHPGQVAFPGGRIDAEDDGPIAAALREANEEIGLPPALVNVIAPLPHYRTATGFVITPVIGTVPPDLALAPHVEEVETIFEVPLAFLLDPVNRQRHEVDMQGRVRRYYEIIWQDFRIWGVTAGIIVNLSRRLDGLW